MQGGGIPILMFAADVLSFAYNNKNVCLQATFTTEYNLLQFNTQIKETKILKFNTLRLYFVYVCWTRFQSINN